MLIEFIIERVFNFFLKISNTFLTSGNHDYVCFKRQTFKSFERLYRFRLYLSLFRQIYRLLFNVISSYIKWYIQDLAYKILDLSDEVLKLNLMTILRNMTSDTVVIFQRFFSESHFPLKHICSSINLCKRNWAKLVIYGRCRNCHASFFFSNYDLQFSIGQNQNWIVNPFFHQEKCHKIWHFHKIKPNEICSQQDTFVDYN